MKFAIKGMHHTVIAWKDVDRKFLAANLDEMMNDLSLTFIMLHSYPIFIQLACRIKVTSIYLQTAIKTV